jgi:hypothetical protein
VSLSCRWRVSLTCACSGRGARFISVLIPANSSVGVTGSGRGVTDYARMGKHKFEEGREE